jgi:hypothetical protein
MHRRVRAIESLLADMQIDVDVGVSDGVAATATATAAALSSNIRAATAATATATAAVRLRRRRLNERRGKVDVHCVALQRLGARHLQMRELAVLENDVATLRFGNACGDDDGDYKNDDDDGDDADDYDDYGDDGRRHLARKRRIVARMRLSYAFMHAQYASVDTDEDE